MYKIKFVSGLGYYVTDATGFPMELKNGAPIYYATEDDAQNRIEIFECIDAV